MLPHKGFKGELGCHRTKVLRVIGMPLHKGFKGEVGCHRTKVSRVKWDATAQRYVLRVKWDATAQRFQG